MNPWDKVFPKSLITNGQELLLSGLPWWLRWSRHRTPLPYLFYTYYISNSNQNLTPVKINLSRTHPYSPANLLSPLHSFKFLELSLAYENTVKFQVFSRWIQEISSYCVIFRLFPSGKDSFSIWLIIGY